MRKLHTYINQIIKTQIFKKTQPLTFKNIGAVGKTLFFDELIRILLPQYVQ